MEDHPGALNYELNYSEQTDDLSLTTHHSNTIKQHKALSRSYFPFKQINHDKAIAEFVYLLSVIGSPSCSISFFTGPVYKYQNYHRWNLHNRYTMIS